MGAGVLCGRDMSTAHEPGLQETIGADGSPRVGPWTGWLDAGRTTRTAFDQGRVLDAHPFAGRSRRRGRLDRSRPRRAVASRLVASSNGSGRE
jgi:hypothetical protein